jgi:hypothetical protein
MKLFGKADTDFNPPFAADLFLLALRSFSEGLTLLAALESQPPTLKLRRPMEVPVVNKPRTACSYFLSNYPALLSPHLYDCGLADGIFTQAFISTSTPDGRSSLDKASTVLEVEV